MKYRTKDIWTATALFTQGFKCEAEVVGKLKNGRNQYEFVFDESPELKEQVYNFQSNNLSLDIKTFEDNFVILKNLTFN